MSGYGTGAMRAVTDVPQRIAAKYSDTSQVGIQVKDTHQQLTLPSTHSQTAAATVSVCAQHAEETSQTVFGQWVKVQLQVGSRPAILVPEAAILRRGEMTAICHNERTLYLRQTRQCSGQLPQHPQQHQGETWYEILAGLNAGETIVVNALDELGDIARNANTDAKPDVK